MVDMQSSLKRMLLCAGLAGTVSIQPAMAQQQNPLAAALDSTVSRMMSLNATPGMGVVVVKDTQIIYMKGFGQADVENKRPFTPSTVFYIASTTKSFTGLTAAVLDQKKQFSLDAPLKQYLPGVQLQAPLNADSITIRSLLTHTHGIANDGPVPVRLAYTGVYSGNDELLKLLASHKATGNRDFKYGNLGYNVAAIAMETRTKESWKKTLEDVLFKPAGMTSTSGYVSRFPQDRLAMPYRWKPEGFVRMPYAKTDANMQSAGGLVTTLEDMGKWLELNINNGKLNGKQVVPAAAVQEAHKLQVTSAGNDGPYKRLGYALGWNVGLNGNDTILVHGGGFPGFVTHMSFNPQKRVGVAVFANVGSGYPEAVALEIYRVLNGEGAIKDASFDTWRGMLEKEKQGIAGDFARRAARPQDLPFPLEAYAGNYDNELYGRLQINVVNGKLEARMGSAWSAIEVFDNTKNRLRIELFGNGQVMDVEMQDGRAVAMNLGGTVYRRVP
jgi:CubicO group peptidase (beta-lactamase class C family)